MLSIYEKKTSTRSANICHAPVPSSSSHESISHFFTASFSLFLSLYCLEQYVCACTHVHFMSNKSPFTLLYVRGSIGQVTCKVLDVTQSLHNNHQRKSFAIQYCTQHVVVVVFLTHHASELTVALLCTI